MAVWLPPCPAAGRGATIVGVLGSRPVVYRSREGEYTAVVLALGLCVQRPTPDAALQELREVQRSYVEDARASGTPSSWLWRPAPWRAWVRVYWMALLTRVGTGAQ
jgi:predicted RNase H-like HicB family nuclease